MRELVFNQKLSFKAQRESLREKGQFWTPEWITEPMVEYVLEGEATTLFDPAVGEGNFFHAAKTVAKEKGLELKLVGMEIDPVVLAQALAKGLEPSDISSVIIGDFTLHSPLPTFKAIVGNPPYIRHHRLSTEVKTQLRKMCIKIMGKPLDGRAGLHIYFLIRALSLLEDNGKLAFIMPADTCEGNFSRDLWRWVNTHFRLEAVITFTSQASPFPGVDINPIILFIRKAKAKENFLWVKCYQPMTDSLKKLVRSHFQMDPPSDLRVIERTLEDGLSTGFSREPVTAIDSGYVLGDFAYVMRGIATGANNFFFMTEEKAKSLGLPLEFFVRAIGRTRDIQGYEITVETIYELEKKGRPTLLLSLCYPNRETYPPALKQYLKKGEEMGLPQKPLISQRRPWFRMELRTPPPFLFAYLGRRNARFIKNSAGVVPLTGFLCVYPHKNNDKYNELLWKILNHPETLTNLKRVAKTYGNNALKVEPRQLESLPIPQKVIREYEFPLQISLF